MTSTIKDPYDSDGFVIAVTIDGYVYRFPADLPETERQVGIGFPAHRIGYVDVSGTDWQATTWTGSILVGDGATTSAVEALVAAEHDRPADFH